MTYLFISAGILLNVAALIGLIFALRLFALTVNEISKGNAATAQEEELSQWSVVSKNSGQ